MNRDPAPESVDTWLMIGVGTAVAMLVAAWGVSRLQRASEEDALAPPSTTFRPRFEPYRPGRTSRTFPPISTRDYDSPSERIYR